MVRLGYEAYIYPAAAITIDRYSYVPYIFSKEELRSIFAICDNYPVSSFSPNRHLILPLLFRMLYGCGLRISEIVPMAETLTVRCRQYAGKVLGCMSCPSFFFPSPYGGSYSGSTIYKLFRKVIWKAGISHSGKGPRLHDVRHSHSVHCLKKWVLNKGDLTNLLPYLSVYLGHTDLRGTQHYLRLTADLYPSIISSVEDNFSSLVPEVISHETD